MEYNRKNSKKYNGIDLMKFVASIFVVSIHCPPLIDFSKKADFNLEIISRFCVPFFFIASAFFLYNKINRTRPEEQRGIIINYMKRIGAMYLFWLVVSVWFVFDKYHELIYTGLGIFLKSFIHDFFLGSTFRGSWYLMASIICGLVIYELCYNKVPSWMQILVVTAIFVLTVLTSAYYYKFDASSLFIQMVSRYENIFAWAGLSWPAGVIYFYIGKKLADYWEKIERIPWRVLCLSVILFGIFMLLEMNYIKSKGWVRISDQFFSLVPFSVSVFLLSAKIKLKDSIVYQWMREISIITYCGQFIFITLMDKLRQNYGLFNFSCIWRYLIVLLLCWGLYFLIKILEKKIKVLKYSY